MKDRHLNTPLHVAVCHGAPLRAVARVCLAWEGPTAAVEQRNFHGRTPLDLANERTASVPDDVAAFLRSQSELLASSRDPLLTPLE